MTATPDPSVVLPMFRGRRGVVNSTICVVIGALCAYGVWSTAERTTIVPACSAYASANQMKYHDFRLVGIRQQATVVCELTRANGTISDKYLRELVPVPVEWLVSFAMLLQVTVPTFTVLAAALMAVVSKRLNSR